MFVEEGTGRSNSKDSCHTVCSERDAGACRTNLSKDMQQIGWTNKSIAQTAPTLDPDAAAAAAGA